MKRWASLGFALFCGCGAPTASAAGASSAGGGTCPPDEAAFAGSCWSAEGSRWRIEAGAPGGRYEFEVTFLAAGRARVSDHPGADRASDEWGQRGSTLRLFLGDRFVEYRAEVDNGTALVGTAENVRGQRWSFTARRIFEEARCADDEAPLGERCLSVAGTRWTIQRENDEEQTIDFRAEGALLVDGAPSEGDGWRQEAEALFFSLGENFTQYVANLEDADRMEGTASDREGRHFSWTATRTPRLPPSR